VPPPPVGLGLGAGLGLGLNSPPSNPPDFFTPPCPAQGVEVLFPFVPSLQITSPPPPNIEFGLPPAAAPFGFRIKYNPTLMATATLLIAMILPVFSIMRFS